MVWKRDSDNVAFDPRVVDVLEHPLADKRSVNEVWGFYQRMMAELANHPNDTHRVSYAQALTIAGGEREQLEVLWDQCVFAGLGSVVELDGGRRAFQCLADPEFVHVLTLTEEQWNRQQKRDNSNPEITVPVRMRDGDVCRYCGLVVWFGQKKGDKRGTYDHRPPGLPGSAETTVVACGACNSARGTLGKGLPPEEALAAADERFPLLPAPGEPYWSPSTREWLRSHLRIIAAAGLEPPPLADEGTKPLPAGSPAPGAAAARLRADPQPATGRSRQNRADNGPGQRAAGGTGQKPAEAKPPGSGKGGTGRDGSDREGAGLVGSERGGQGRPDPARRARRYRGSRGGRR